MSAIELVEAIQKREFPLSQVLDNSLLMGLMGYYGMRLLHHVREFQNTDDCAAFVLGRDNGGHGFLFIPHGRRVEHFVFGAIVSYGLYSSELAELAESGVGDSNLVLLDHQEARARLAEQKDDDKYKVYFEGKHIGNTTSSGTVRSKWGRNGHAFEHPPHIVPSLYGEFDYFVLPVPVENSVGELLEVFIMPHALLLGAEEKMQFILTDGRQEVGRLVGRKDGWLGDSGSVFEVEVAQNLTQDFGFNGVPIPKLIETVIRFISRTPDLVGEIRFSNNAVFLGENPARSLRVWNVDIDL